MKWFVEVITSSIGKKLLMALTGLGFCLFLAVHLGGNLTLFGGKEMFTSYVEHLHALGILITFAEIGLLGMAVIHVLTGLWLFYQNFRSRPVRYKYNKNAGGRTIGSQTMPYTGVILLLFIIYHLLDFHFVDKTNTTTFQIVAGSFSNPLVTGFYIIAVVIAAIHVSHGFWSAFQTLGLNHPKYFPLIRAIAIIFSLAVGIGFGLIPIYVTMIA